MYENIYRYPSGAHESSIRNSSQSGSSINVNRWSSLVDSKSAHSGSSVADDNLSAEAFDPTTHYYTHREDYHRHLSAEGWFQSRGDRAPYARPRQQSASTSSFYSWKILTSVANRVVTSTSCETRATLTFIAQNKLFGTSMDWLLLTGDDAYFAQQYEDNRESHSVRPTDASSINTYAKSSSVRHSRSSVDNNSNSNHGLTPIASLSNPKSSSIQDYPNYNIFINAEPLPSVSEKADVIDEEEVPQTPKPSPLEGTSLFIFSKQNRLRIFLWKLLRSQYVEVIVFLFIFLQWILLASTPIYTNTDKTSFGGTNIHYIILAIQCVYSLEIMAKIIVYGLILPHSITLSNTTKQKYLTVPLGSSLPASVLGKCLSFLTFGFVRTKDADGTRPSKNSNIQLSPITPTSIPSNSFIPLPTGDVGRSELEPASTLKHRPYLSNFGNWLDIISVVCYWIDLALMEIDYNHISLFKGLGAARPLRLVGIIPGTAVIMQSLEASLQLLFNVFGFVFFFMLVFALIGVMTYKGAFMRACYQIDVDGNAILAEPSRMCSGYYDGPNLIGIYIQELDVYDYPRPDGYICPSGLVCRQVPGTNPSYGFLNMDNLYFSLLNLFTVMSLEGWSDMMYDAQDGESTTAAAFFTFAIYILSFIMIPLFIAVITTSFAQVRSESRMSAFTAKRITHPILLPADPVDDSFWTYGQADLSRLRNTALAKQYLSSIVNNWKFTYFGALLVLCNLIIMACRSIYASDYTLEAIDTAEIIFSFIFAIEIFLRLLGSRTWVQFWMSGRNRFDLFLVVATCIIQLPMIQGSSAYKYLTIFQCLRFYRLILCLPRVRRLLSSAIGSGEGVINVGLFLLWSTALFAPISMQLFGGDFGFMDYDEQELRFDTFLQAFLSLFDLFTSENWTDVLYNSMESQYEASAIYAALFMVALYCFSHYIILNLFVAVILENFELDEDKIRVAQIKSYFRRHRPPESEIRKGILDKILEPLQQNRLKRQLNVDNLPRDFHLNVQKSMFQDILFPNKDTTKDMKPAKKSVANWIVDKANEYFFAPAHNPYSHMEEQFLDEPTDDYELVVAEENRSAKQDNIPALPSLFFFSPNNRFRRWCKQLVGSSSSNEAERKSLFNWFIMACVLASIFIVVLDEPAARKLQQYIISPSAYDTIDYTLTAIFVLEIIIRIVADGFVMVPDSYLRDPWNQLDFCVVILTVATVFGGASQVPRTLRTVRSFRILRLIRYFPGVRHIFSDLIHGFPLMIDALILTVLVLVPFCIYAVNIFGGRFFLCNDNSVGGLSECNAEFLNPIGDDADSPSILIPRVWANPYGYDFDTFPTALLHLFDLTSTEGWILTLFSAMSTPTDADVQPVFDWTAGTVYHCLYFVVFMVIAHGTVQLFVGVILENFKQRNGISTLTIPQRQYLDLRRQLAQVKPTRKPVRPTNPIRSLCYDLVINKQGLFHKIMVGIVMLNIVVICTEYEDEPVILSQVQDYLYVAFIFCYLCEVLIKLIGLGWRKWIQNKWNRYDCVIVVCTITMCILRFTLENLWTQRIEQYLLVLVSMRLGQGFSSLQTLFHAVQASLPSILNVSAIFMMVMCLFAMLFMEFFGLTKYGPYGTDHANFRSYGNSLLTLVRMTTGENWDFLMHDFTVSAPNCVSASSADFLDSDCGSAPWAYLLFIVFYIICTHIFLNLFTVVIISNFQYAYEHTARFTLITKTDLQKFKQAWAEVDPKGTGYIPKTKIAALFRHLHGRFDLRIYADGFSLQELQALAKKEFDELGDEKASSLYTNPELMQLRYRYDEVNTRLALLDLKSTEQRRKQYNMLYTEVLWTQTSKGISFDSALLVMAYRFIDPQEFLTLDRLLDRLERLEKIQRNYAVEKVRGYFLTLAERKRYLRKLWEMANEEEIRRLSILQPNDSNFPNEVSKLLGRASVERPIIPKIVINSDMGDNQTSYGDSTSLSPYPTSLGSGTYDNAPLSPNFHWSTTTAGSPHSEHAGMPSPSFRHDGPLTPSSPASYMASQDGSSVSHESEADMLIDNFNSSVWSDLLRHETDVT
ncbi:unnamed protein product [Umbelopsis ramanniana]